MSYEPKSAGNKKRLIHPAYLLTGLNRSDSTPTARRERIPALPLRAIHPMTAPIALPTIHLNGTGASTLRAEYRRLSEHTMDTIDALADATCNPRDFYSQGPEAFQQALADRREMFRLLQLVQDYANQWEARAAEHLRD